MLQRQVDVQRKEVGHGVDEPHEHDGKERGTKEARPAEEQHDAGCVGEGYKGVRRHKDGPRGSKDELQDGVIAQVYEADGGDEEDEAPPGAVHLPVQRAPGAQDEEETEDGDESTDGFERVGGPERPQREDGGEDREGSQDAQDSRHDDGPAHTHWSTGDRD
jgi:hypothetical protein